VEDTCKPGQAAYLETCTHSKDSTASASEAAFAVAVHSAAGQDEGGEQVVDCPSVVASANQEVRHHSAGARHLHFASAVEGSLATVAYSGHRLLQNSAVDAYQPA
jgi:hypothetical protein